MNGMVARRSAVAVLCVLAGWPAVAWAGKPLEGIPLVWKPTNKNAGVVNLVGITNVKFRVEPFTDSRADKKKIAENQEDKVPKPVTTSGDVAQFCTEHFAETLRRNGLSVVSEGGDVVIGGEVMDFMVIETNTYTGEVRLKLTVKRAATKGGSAWIRHVVPVRKILQGRELLRDASAMRSWRPRGAGGE